LESELSRRSAVYREGTKNISFKELGGSLPKGAALIDYFEYCSSHASLSSNSVTGVPNYLRSLLAFVVRPGQDIAMLDLGAVEPIHEAIHIWREGNFGAAGAARDAAERLRRLLWEPLLPALGDATTILISTDGLLGKLPFAAIPGKSPGTYLLEDHRLVLAPVPSLLPAMFQSGPSQKLEVHQVLLVGDVDYDKREEPRHPMRVASGSRRVSRQIDARDHRRYESRHGTAKEVDFISNQYKELYPATKIAYLRGAQATEEAFRGFAPHCELLHVATHGFSDKTSVVLNREAEGLSELDSLERDCGHHAGLFSGLVFAGANHPPVIPDDPSEWDEIGDDGILTADEIAFLRLEGVRLAVLSACETGLGEVAGGEGLLGLQRAFQVSGTRSTIATLWNVEDGVTQLLMKRFYSNFLEKKMSTCDALREAQLWALDNPDQILPRRPNIALRGEVSPLRNLPVESSTVNKRRLPPEYWAAFVFSGDWR
jgi:CHAT domain-containing protein